MGIYDRDYYRGDTPSSGLLSGEGSVCKRLIAINIAVYMLQLVTFNPRGGDVTAWLNLDLGSIFQKFQLWRLVTWAFCHDPNSLLHILFNMLGLWWFGKPLEGIYGGRAFARLYLGAAVVSAIVFLAFSAATGINASAEGASGAVMAVLAISAMFFPTQVIYFIIIPIQLRWFVGLYLIYDLYPVLLAFSGHGQADGVAHAAHLGGLFYGYIFKTLNLQDMGSGLEETWLHFRRRFKARIRGAGPVKIYRPPEPEAPPANLEQRVDEILAKISAQGEASLTDAERQELKDASRRYKQR